MPVSLRRYLVTRQGGPCHHARAPEWQPQNYPIEDSSSPEPHFPPRGKLEVGPSGQRPTAPAYVVLAVRRGSGAAQTVEGGAAAGPL